MKTSSHGSRLFLGLTLFSALTLSPAFAESANIVGGNPVADFDTTPYIAQFVKEKGPMKGVWCGATVIDKNWVLTAGHCSDLVLSKKISLYAGTLGVGKKGENPVRLDPDAVYVHPGYKETSSSVHYDFALAHLKTPIDFENTRIKPATLPSEDFVNRGNQSPGVMATTRGWGALVEGGGSPETLMEVDVPLVELQKAKQSYPDYDQSMIAAGYDAGEKDSCNGDSGGPLVTKDTVTGADTLIGVVSFGNGCARWGFYGIYSRVSEALPWIQKITQDKP